MTSSRSPCTYRYGVLTSEDGHRAKVNRVFCGPDHVLPHVKLWTKKCRGSIREYLAKTTG
eukprot:scaffold62849_cov42-Attheya_sp.AAC.1